MRALAVQTPSNASDQPTQAAVLLTMVIEARQGVERRLAELGVSASTGKVEGAMVSRKTRTRSTAVSTLSVCVNACRACGRALGAAFHEAQSMADAASARILYFSIRDFEKQLWVLDPRQVH